MATPLIEPVAKLIEAFARLPGIGPKTAQRLTYHLLRAPDAEARTLAAALVAVRDQVVFCERCFNIADQELCAICRDGGRDQRRLCIVEEPLDVLALERTAEFKGLYHVLHGAISPIDGIGPERLRIRERKLKLRREPIHPHRVAPGTKPARLMGTPAADSTRAPAKFSANFKHLRASAAAGTAPRRYLRESALARTASGGRDR